MRSHDYFSDFSDDNYPDDDYPGVHRGGRRSTRRRRARFDDEREPARPSQPTPAPAEAPSLIWRREDEADSAPPEGGSWSSWDGSEHGPTPYPPWLVTDHSAVDTELGVLKSGKEADVHLVRRELPGTDRSCLLAAKRYRPPEHRMFHRDAGYLEGRRVRRSREMRAMAGRTAFGRSLIADQWAAAEFGALSRLWSIGAPVPYPAQWNGREVMLEFLGDPDGTAAPRLAQLRPDPELLAELWRQLTEAMLLLARAGLTHGDLSAYNLLVHGERLVLIDLPQVVDLVGNPSGDEFLGRDVHNITAWFEARGLPARLLDPEALFARLVAEAFGTSAG
ncbi:serine protein kinase RIO [Pseudonocardia acaciae]|uniref:serine protein kinase RIO n=1 Tax=Pseudonocardia acaciae TaxID=551276 RepID=UPI00048A80EB|nr:RIO1 family regulatory kinase/ATPase [Pseudonocardia acaciae]